MCFSIKNYFSFPFFLNSHKEYLIERITFLFRNGFYNGHAITTSERGLPQTCQVVVAQLAHTPMFTYQKTNNNRHAITTSLLAPSIK